MKSILRLAEMSNLSALSILFVSVLNEVVVSFLGYIICVETRSCSYIPRNFLSNLVFVDGMIVPKIGSIDAACPVNYVRNCFRTVIRKDLTSHYKELQARWVLPMPFRQMVLDYRSLPCSDTSTNAKNM